MGPERSWMVPSVISVLLTPWPLFWAAASELASASAAAANFSFVFMACLLSAKGTDPTVGPAARPVLRSVAALATAATPATGHKTRGRASITFAAKTQRRRIGDIATGD